LTTLFTNTHVSSFNRLPVFLPSTDSEQSDQFRLFFFGVVKLALWNQKDLYFTTYCMLASLLYSFNTGSSSLYIAQNLSPSSSPVFAPPTDIVHDKQVSTGE